MGKRIPLKSESLIGRLVHLNFEIDYIWKMILNDEERPTDFILDADELTVLSKGRRNIKNELNEMIKALKIEE